MQGPPTLDIALIGLPGIIIGLIIGYAIGGMKDFRLIDRIGLGIIISGIGGLLLSLGYSFIITIESTEIFFIIFSIVGGYIFGLFLNWTPPARTKKKQHIIYEHDDEDAFDREIDEALRGKQ